MYSDSIVEVETTPCLFDDQLTAELFLRITIPVVERPEYLLLTCPISIGHGVDDARETSVFLGVAVGEGVVFGVFDVPYEMQQGVLVCQRWVGGVSC